MWSSDKVPATKVEGIQIRTAFWGPWSQSNCSYPTYLDLAYEDVSDFAIGLCFASAGPMFDNATSNEALKLTKKKMRLWRMSQIPFNFVRKLFYVKITQPRKFSQNCCLMPLIALNFSIQILLLFNFHNTDKIFFK